MLLSILEIVGLVFVLFLGLVVVACKRGGCRIKPGPTVKNLQNRPPAPPPQGRRF